MSVFARPLCGQIQDTTRIESAHFVTCSTSTDVSVLLISVCHVDSFKMFCVCQQGDQHWPFLIHCCDCATKFGQPGFIVETFRCESTGIASSTILETLKLEDIQHAFWEQVQASQSRAKVLGSLGPASDHSTGTMQRLVADAKALLLFLAGAKDPTSFLRHGRQKKLSTSESGDVVVCVTMPGSNLRT